MDGPLVLSTLTHNMTWSALKGIEAFYQNMGKYKKSAWAGIIFVEPTKEPSGDQLTQDCTGNVHTLVYCLGLVPKKGYSVGQQAID